MGKPVSFGGANTVLKGSEGSDILDLPCYVHENYDGAVSAWSCWEIDELELAEITKTRKVWLNVLGSGHPPVYVTGRSPLRTKSPIEGE